jgi:hypothetical protein
VRSLLLSDAFFISTATRGRGLGSTTMKRITFRQEEVRVLKEEVTLWISRVLAISLNNDSLLDELSDGIVLCRLVIKVSPDVVKTMGRVHENAKPGSFFSHENVQSFLKVGSSLCLQTRLHSLCRQACTQLGVVPYALFESNALIAAQKDTRAVVLCVLALARVSVWFAFHRSVQSSVSLQIAVSYGIEPPEVVKFEKEIDLIKAGKFGKFSHRLGPVSFRPHQQPSCRSARRDDQGRHRRQAARVLQAARPAHA